MVQTFKQTTAVALTPLADQRIQKLNEYPALLKDSVTCVLLPNILVYLFIRFARISDRRFIAICYKFQCSMYILGPLVIDRRGLVQREI
jgi:uncharacterized membrane protein